MVTQYLTKDDECPDVPGTVANNGCPEGPSEEEMKMITELSRGIQFAFGSATFTDGAHLQYLILSCQLF
jgi:hypothetical protein